MKFKQLLISLLTVVKLSNQFVFTSSSDWKKISETPSRGFYLVEISKETASIINEDDLNNENILKNLKEQFMLTNTENQLQTSIYDSYKVTEVKIFKSIYKARRGIFIKISSKKSQENFKGKLFFTTSDSRLRRTLFTITNQNYYEIDLKAHWIESENTAWESTSFTVFKWLNRILSALKLYVVFFRPILKNTHKIPVAWFTSSIISLQLLAFIPFLNGDYGGVIEEINFGILNSFYGRYGFDLNAIHLIPNWLRVVAEDFRGNFNYEISHFVGNPILANQANLIFFVFSEIFVWFSRVLRNRRLIYLSKSMKSGVIMVSAVPLITESTSCLISIFVYGEFATSNILSLVSSFLILGIFAYEFWTLCRHPQGYMSHDSMYEVGLLEFDCHNRTQIKRIFKIGEFFLSLLIPITTFVLANSPSTAKILILIFYFLIMLLNCLKARSNRWRKDIEVINRLKIAENFTKITMITLLLITDLSPEISLSWIKIFTWAYVCLLGINILIHFFIIIDRIFYESNKIYRWSLKEARYPEQPRTLIDAEKALRSIGKGKNERRVYQTNQVMDINICKGISSEMSNRKYNFIVDDDPMEGTDQGEKENRLGDRSIGEEDVRMIKEVGSVN